MRYQETSGSERSRAAVTKELLGPLKPDRLCAQSIGRRWKNRQTKWSTVQCTPECCVQEFSVKWQVKHKHKAFSWSTFSSRKYYVWDVDSFLFLLLLLLFLLQLLRFHPPSSSSSSPSSSPPPPLLSLFPWRGQSVSPSWLKRFSPVDTRPHLLHEFTRHGRLG